MRFLTNKTFERKSTHACQSLDNLYTQRVCDIIARLSFIFTTLFIHFAFEWQTRIKIFDERSPVTGSEISFLVFPYLFFTLLTVHFFSALFISLLILWFFVRRHFVFESFFFWWETIFILAFSFWNLRFDISSDKDIAMRQQQCWNITLGTWHRVSNKHHTRFDHQPYKYILFHCDLIN